MKFIKAFIVLLYLCSFSLLINAQEKIEIGWLELGVTEFYLQLNEKYDELLIDVRPYKDYRKERIPGAILASTIDELYQIVDTLDFEKPIYLYCEYGDRSADASKLLIYKGFKYIYNLSEGLLGWKEHELVTDKTKLPRKRF